MAHWPPESLVSDTTRPSGAPRGTTRHKILVVEDDHVLLDVLCRGLYEEGFEPVPAADGATALRLATGDIAAVVLDIGLPDADGRDVCQALRANGFLASVIFLTAQHQLADRLSGFSAGGDDYLAKPFHLAELTARPRASVKRAAPAVIAVGDLILDAVGHRVTVHGTAVALSPRSSGCWPRSWPRTGASFGAANWSRRAGRRVPRSVATHWTST